MTKRIVSILLAVMMILTVLPVSMASAVILGNLNDDPKITAADARIALRASVNLETLTAEQEIAADVNFDGKITAADARLILRASVGLENLHTHDYKTETVITAATCTSAGEKKLSCECGEYITEAIPAKGHTPVTDNAVAATCTKTGLTEGSHCSVCNAVLKAQTTTNKAAHTPAVDESTKIAVTCKENGYSGDTKCTVCKTLISNGSVITSTGTEHVTEYVNYEATCGQEGYKVKECKYCDYVDINSKVTTAEAMSHSWGAETTVNPTCTEEGYTTKTCTRCEAVEKTITTAATGHTYTWTVTTKSTCKETGERTGTCTKCSASTKEPLPLANHTTKEKNLTNPCRKAQVCTVCDKIVSSREFHETRMLSYDPDGDGENGKAATCTTPETIESYCINCDEYGNNEITIEIGNVSKTYKTRTIIKSDPLGHDAPKDEVNSYDATCENEGVWIYTGTCQRDGCNEELDGTEIRISPKGHDLISEQTCTTDAVCNNKDFCDYKDQNCVVAERFGHDIHLDTAAFSEDVTTFFCARCGVEPEKNNKTNTLTLFNLLTDNIKTGNHFVNYSYSKYGSSLINYVNKSSIETSYSRFDFGAFTSQIRDLYEEEMANTPDDYSSVQLMSYKFGLPVDEYHVSKLSANDIDSIKAERFTGVKLSEIIASFNPTYTRETDIQRFAALKNANAINENVIKVTINVKNEKYTTLKSTASTTETSLQKVFGLDIREEAKKYTDQPPLNEGGDGFSISMTTKLNDIATDGEVTYYFLEKTYEPIVAVYDSDITISQEIDMTFKIGLFSLNGEMDPIIKTHTTSVYVFPILLAK